MHLGNFAGGWSHAKPRRREGKRTGSVFGVWCLVFGWASRGRESAGTVPRINANGCWGDFSFPLSRLSSLWHGCHVPLTPDPSPPFHGGEGRLVCLSFRKRIAPLAPGKGRGAGGEGSAPPMHPSRLVCCIRLLYSRAGCEEQRRKTEAVSVLNRPSLLSTFAHLLCMAWMPSPPHPRPLSPVSRGRGEIFGESAGAVPRINAGGCWGDFSFPLSRLSFLWQGCHAGAPFDTLAVSK